MRGRLFTVGIGFTLFTVVLALCWSRVPAPPAPATPESFFLIVPELGPPAEWTQPDSPDRRRENATDFYGNDVTSAIATYKLDRSGSIYEEHAPRTALPRLAPPEA
jgi:hypothetical protein